MSESTTDDDSEYRPTDYLAVCGFSYGYGQGKDDAVLNALRFEGPFNEDQRDTVEVAVWELYADSWTSHSPNGPERGADQLSFEKWELPIELAAEAAALASDANSTLSRAYMNGELLDEQGEQ